MSFIKAAMKFELALNTVLVSASVVESFQKYGVLPLGVQTLRYPTAAAVTYSSGYCHHTRALIGSVEYHFSPDHLNGNRFKVIF